MSSARRGVRIPNHDSVSTITVLGKRGGRRFEADMQDQRSFNVEVEWWSAVRASIGCLLVDVGDGASSALRWLLLYLRTQHTLLNFDETIRIIIRKARRR